jgi:hypothetical protein
MASGTATTMASGTSTTEAPATSTTVALSLSPSTTIAEALGTTTTVPMATPVYTPTSTRGTDTTQPPNIEGVENLNLLNNIQQYLSEMGITSPDTGNTNYGAVNSSMSEAAAQIAGAISSHTSTSGGTSAARGSLINNHDPQNVGFSFINKDFKGTLNVFSPTLEKEL